MINNKLRKRVDALESKINKNTDALYGNHLLAYRTFGEDDVVLYNKGIQDKLMPYMTTSTLNINTLRHIRKR